jgi:ubiquinone/menaquinone biosynthesis C-methylase UbiE
MAGVGRNGVRAVRLVLAALFLVAGTIKLLGVPDAVAAFERLGWGQAFRVFIGVCEVAGALGLLVAPLAAPAAAALAVLMAGAVAAELLVLADTPAQAAVPLVTGLGCLFVARAEWVTIGSLRVFRTGKGPMDGWLAEAYDRGVQAAFREVISPVVAEVTAELRAARRVLDVGCGPGQFTLMAAEYLPGAEIWGIDLAPTMIELARAHAREAGAGRVRFQVADAAALPFPDGTFDAVMSTGSIKHWPDPVAGLREIHRVLVPGGRAFVAEMNRMAPPAAIGAQRRRLRHWLFRWVYPRVFDKALSPDDARALFRASPFGRVVGERMILDGCIWIFEARREPAAAS